MFLVALMYCAPYGTEALNATQSTAVLANVLTLFVGIMTIIDMDMEDAALQAGQSYDTTSRSVISVVIVIANIAVIAIPIIVNIMLADNPSKSHASNNMDLEDAGHNDSEYFHQEIHDYSQPLTLPNSVLLLPSPVLDKGNTVGALLPCPILDTLDTVQCHSTLVFPINFQCIEALDMSHLVRESQLYPMLHLHRDSNIQPTEDITYELWAHEPDSHPEAGHQKFRQEAFKFGSSSFYTDSLNTDTTEVPCANLDFMTKVCDDFEFNEQPPPPPPPRKRIQEIKPSNNA